MKKTTIQLLTEFLYQYEPYPVNIPDDLRVFETLLQTIQTILSKNPMN